jgi:hypothetical protein
MGAGELVRLSSRRDTAPAAAAAAAESKEYRHTGAQQGVVAQLPSKERRSIYRGVEQLLLLFAAPA